MHNLDYIDLHIISSIRSADVENYFMENNLFVEVDDLLSHLKYFDIKITQNKLDARFDNLVNEGYLLKKGCMFSCTNKYTNSIF
jgi:hypothetical protein